MLRGTRDERFAPFLMHYDPRNVPQILFWCMRPSVEKVFDFESYTFRQNIDPQHTAQIFRIDFKNQQIDALPRPAQNRDLNPIENLWLVLVDTGNEVPGA